MGYRNIGKALAEWNDSAPLVVTLSEKVGTEDAPHLTAFTFDLSDLQQGFSENFLLNLKDLLLDWRNRISLVSLELYTRNIKYLFKRIISLQLFDVKIDLVDETFLLVLSTVTKEMTKTQLNTFKLSFVAHPYSLLWGPGLQADSFPRFCDNKGAYGQQINRVLAKALTRAACVHILSGCEHAYDTAKIDIGLFAFANLAFAVFCRPESYRQIRLGDLVFDTESQSYFLYILPVKTRTSNPDKIVYRINAPLGILLQKQRQDVVKKYSHLVDSKSIDRLALFPARRLNQEKSAWIHGHANEQFGMYKRDAFTHGYARQIERLFESDELTLNSNALRHTVGTQLAQSGASARTIQAVLKHATDSVCKAYVDIAFNGLIDSLSDAMQPAFDTHLPVFKRFRSKQGDIDPSRAIRSDDLTTGQTELTGECGRFIKCEFAPITCYGCSRFIPCWDADHKVNLDIVEREIDDYKKRGKPFEHLIEKARTSKYQIILVMNAADRYQSHCMQEPRP